jgi:hypothetical protein
MIATAPIKKDIPIRGYHSGARRRIKSVEGEYYGFEMEVDFPGKQMRGYGASVPNGNVVRSRYQLDAETDGSLLNSGIELITKRPLKITELRGKWMNSILTRMTDEMGVQRGKQPHNYGLHVNVNLAGMTVVETMAFFATLNFAMSQARVQNDIMERAGSYIGLEGAITHMLQSAPPLVGETDTELAALTKLSVLHANHNLREKALPFARHNYAGIRHAKSPIAEVRGFHMNTDIEAFKKKAELVQKARRFANDNANTMLNLFVHSLAKNKNVLTQMSDSKKNELLDAILNTSANAPLLKKEFVPDSRALALFAQFTTEEFREWTLHNPTRTRSRIPACDSTGTLRTHR